MSNSVRHSHAPKQHRLRTRHAVASAVLLLGSTAGPLQAGVIVGFEGTYYDYAGSVFSGPVDLVPTIDTGNATLNLGDNRLFVGGGNSAGSFSALAGAQMTAGGLVAGLGGNGTGSISVSGAGTLVNLGGSGRVDIGSWGTGSLTVAGGAVVNGTVNPAFCLVAGNYCGGNIGNGAGSTATLTITGAGSELRTLSFLAVANAQVNTVANGGFDFGTAGGSTTATINILNGGVLRSQNTSVGFGAGGAALNGNESALATVTINGTGSQWVVSPNTVNPSTANMTIGDRASATGNVTVSGGGMLRIDASGSPGPFDGISVGGNGNGTLTITGAGSRFIGGGANRYISVGAGSATASGTLQVLAGGSAESLYLNVGRNGGLGTLLVDGTGSLLTLSGVGVDFPNVTGDGTPAFLTVGRDGGTGSAVVSNGGAIRISDGGADGRTPGGSPGLQLGRGANAHGTLLISGAGSFVEVVSSALPGLAAGVADNLNPFVAIGADNPATSSGTLTVSNGGQLILSGNALSTPANGRVTQLAIGGRSGTAGNGTATVTGAGSEIRVGGYDAFISVGRTAGGSGTLNVLDHAQVSSTSLLAGESATGTVTVDNATLALSGVRTDSSNVGAGATFGRGSGGNGQLVLRNGARFTVTPTILPGGISVGGDQFLSGGSGSIDLSGGSSISFAGTLSGDSLTVGYNGSGSATLTGASSIDVGNTGDLRVGRLAGGTGTLGIAGGSVVRANSINIGGVNDSTAGGTGSVSLSGAGSLLSASGASGFIGVGRFGGTGTLTVASGAAVNAIVMNVGRGAGSSGTLTVNGGTLALAGEQTGGSPSVGAAFSVGNRGGTGTASFVNGSQLTLNNPGTLGVSLNVGGTPVNPLGTGTLTVAGGSSVALVAAPGLATVRIGHDGSGTASISGASTLDAGDGKVIIAGLPGSTGTLTLSGGSVLTAGYVGVGSLPGGVDGGSARLIVNASTVNATTVEIGTGGLLGGHLGVVNASVINRGIVSPGNSPGHIIINGRFDTTGGTVVLDVEDTGGGSFAVDKLVLTDTSTFDFAKSKVVFNFIGNTDPTAFAATGGLDLDNFIEVKDTATGAETGLSSKLATQGSSWEQAFTGANFQATSSAYAITTTLKLDTSGTFTVTALPVPEPQTWALWLLGVGALAWRCRRAQLPARPWRMA